MRKILCLALLVALGAHSWAQSVEEDFGRNIHLSGSNHLAYPGPARKTLTPSPEGKSPFYISHYGRHGSRYLISPNDCDMPYYALLKADSAGVLTMVGKDVVRRLDIVRKESEGRLGELSPLGALQHREIAHRMYERFPEVFQDSVWVDAKSTVVIRCILSMENELLELARLNPTLRFKHDASKHDMYYMNYDDTTLFSQRRNAVSRKVYEDFVAEHIDTSHLLQQLFTDIDYAKANIDIDNLYAKLFKVASIIQNTEARDRVTLYDLFTDKDVYNSWRCSNLRWYLDYGFAPANGACQPYAQRNLLRKIIEEADSCIALEHPGATLRFGHDTMVLPLTCLMGINGYDLQTDDYEHLDDKGWIDYKVFPMGSNIQLIFYRHDASDEDVVVKVLLNEDEATLPIATDIAPYYHWKDVREYYLKKIDDYEASLTPTLPEDE